MRTWRAIPTCVGTTGLPLTGAARDKRAIPTCVGTTLIRGSARFHPGRHSGHPHVCGDYPGLRVILLGGRVR